MFNSEQNNKFTKVPSSNEKFQILDNSSDKENENTLRLKKYKILETKLLAALQKQKEIQSREKFQIVEPPPITKDNAQEDTLEEESSTIAYRIQRNKKIEEDLSKKFTFNPQYITNYINNN
ncbi:unknown [Mycoplasma sp. CAG:877]|jgi:hypothetical protein|nr:unknown [Mycoplasma sp. CAG:877]